MSTPEWAAQGRCAGGDPDLMFPKGKVQRQVRQLCGPCPVRAKCLADALDNRTEYGVWGGKTERERRILLRDHPNVRSWAKLFESAA